MRVSENRCCLETDVGARSFFSQADTASDLFYDLSCAEAEQDHLLVFSAASVR